MARTTYAITILFPVALVWRWLTRSRTDNPKSDVRPLPGPLRWLNPLLAGLLAMEAAWLRWLPWRLPFGLSVMALSASPRRPWKDRPGGDESSAQIADMMMNSRRFLVVVLLGLAIRLFLIALPGTEDMQTYQIWGARAVEQGITRVYIYEDSDYLYKVCLALKRLPVSATPPYYETQLGPLDHVPDYPPLSLYAFWLATWAAQAASGGKLAAGPLLNALFNVLPVLCSLGIVLLVGRFARREGLAISTAAIAAFWLNPVLILHTPTLGYVDAVFALLELGALAALFQRKFTCSAALLALACTTKPQAALALPIAALVIWIDDGWRGVVRPALIFALRRSCLSCPSLPRGVSSPHCAEWSRWDTSATSHPNS